MDWVTASSMATAAGTLVLALATFHSVRSSNRSARVAELSLLAGNRPLLIPSREEDPSERIRFGDGHVVTVRGHGAAFDVANDNIYAAMTLRNGGSGLAVIHGWRAEVAELSGNAPAPAIENFRRQQRDLYIPAGDTGFWQGAIRDRADPSHESLCAAARGGARVVIDILYGDHEGGQRTIARFGFSAAQKGSAERAEVLRYWNVDRADPR